MTSGCVCKLQKWDSQLRFEAMAWLAARSSLQRTENAAFVCESEGYERDFHGIGAEVAAKCFQCRPPVPWDLTKVLKVLEHNAAHILFDTTLSPTLEFCGLCLQPSPSCFFVLRNGKGSGTSCQVDLRKSRCQNLGRFSYASAVTETPHSPCTNVPITCPLCPSTASAIWKYNIKAHFSNNHRSADFEQHVSNSIISESEKAALRIKWEKRHKTRRSKTSKRLGAQVPLTISEHHSSRLVLS